MIPLTRIPRAPRHLPIVAAALAIITLLTPIASASGQPASPSHASDPNAAQIAVPAAGPIAVPTAAPTAAPTVAPAADALLLPDGLMLAPVRLNGAGPFLFLVDTAATHTMVSDRLAARLRLPRPAGERAGSGSEGGRGRRVESLGRDDRPAETVLVATLDVDAPAGSSAARFADVSVVVMDLAALRDADPRIDGVLGQDLLSTRSHLLDYAAGRLRFDADGAIRRELSGIPVPLALSYNRPMLTGIVSSRSASAPDELSDRRALRLVLDSAATHTILLDAAARPTVRALARRHADGETRRLSTHGGVRTVPMLRLDTLMLPTAPLHALEAAVAPLPPDQERVEDGLLPTSLFRALYFDVAARTVLLNPVRRTPGADTRETATTIRY